MTLNKYYDIIIDKYKSNDYKLKVAKTSKETPVINEQEFPLYAINYLIFEYLRDNKDDRWKLLLDFVLVPNNVNNNECDIDFTKVDFEEFFYFMVSIKS